MPLWIVVLATLTLFGLQATPPHDAAPLDRGAQA